jgi:hypothetical protein
MLVLVGAVPAAFAADQYPEGGSFEDKNEYIEQNVATKEALMELVTETLGDSKTLSGIIGKLITPEMIGAMVTPVIETYLASSDKIVELAAPLIKSAVATELGELGIADQSVLDLVNGVIDEVLASDAVDTVLDSDFTQDVLARAIAYAVVDLTGALDGGEIVDAAMADAMEAVADTIFNKAPIDVLGVPVKSPLEDTVLLGHVVSTAAENTFLGYTSDSHRESYQDVNLSYYDVAWEYEVGYTLKIVTNLLNGHTFTAPGQKVTLNYRKGLSLTSQEYTAELNSNDQLCVTPTTGLSFTLYPQCVDPKLLGKPAALTVTGWNKSMVKLAVAAGALEEVGVQVTSNSQQYYDEVLAKMNVQEIVTNALLRAVKDEIVERINDKILEIRTDLYQRLTDALAEFGIVVELDAQTDDLQAVGQKISDALKALAQEAYDKLVEYLQAAPDTAPAFDAGQPVVGQSVAISAGEWNPVKTKIDEITYEWRIAGSDQVIGTGTSIEVPAAAVGRQLEVTVTAPSHLTSMIPSQFGEDLVWREVFRSPTVVPGELAVVTPLALDNANPTIEDTIAVEGGEFSPAADLAYQWSVGGRRIDGATNASLYIEPAYADHVVSVEVTASVADGSYQPFVRTLSTAPVVKKLSAVVTSSSYSTSTPKVGQTVSLTAPEFSPEAAAVYQWYLDDAAIDGANSASVLVLPAWAGHRLSAQVTSANVVGWTAAFVNLPVLEVAPGDIVLSEVELSGRALVGQTVSAAVEVEPEGATLAYEWFEDQNGTPAKGAVAEGSNGAGFVPAAEAVGKPLVVKVTATLEGHTTATQSAATGPVESNQIQVDAQINGQAQVGRELTVEVSTPATPVSDLAYQWFVDGQAVDGATSDSYTVRPADAGKTVSVQVTATPKDAAYPAVQVERSAGKAAEGLIELGAVSLDNSKPQVGQTVTVVVDSVHPADAKLGYVWFSAGQAVGKGSSYTPTADDLGKALRAEVTANLDGYATATASATAAEPTGLGTIKLSNPVISGTAQVGAKLTASATAEPADDVKLTYFWYRGQTLRAGGPEYIPTASDLGKELRVVVLASASGYGNSRSEATTQGAVVAGSKDPSELELTTPQMYAPHLATVGETVMATAMATAGATITFEWFSDAAATEPALGDPFGDHGEYFIPSAMAVGSTLYVKATAQLAGYSTVATATSNGVPVYTNVLDVTAKIKGVAKVGVELSAGASAAQDADATLSYVWKVNGTEVGYDSSYTPTADDAAKTVLLTVRAEPSRAPWAAGEASAESGPVAKGDVTLTGLAFDTTAPVVGAEVRVTGPSSVPTGRKVTYTWHRGHSKGVTLAEDVVAYTPVPDDLGFELVVVATAAGDAGYNPAVATAQSAAVGLGAIKLDAPVVTGQPVVGLELSAEALAQPETASVSYVWMRGATPVGEDAAYTPVPEDLGQSLSVVATARASGYGDSRAETVIGEVKAGAFTVGALSVSPAPVVGVASKASVASVPSGASVAYEWKVAGKAVSSAQSYTPAAAQVGKSLTVSAVVSKAGYTSKTVSFGPVQVKGNAAAGANNYRSFTLSPDMDEDGKGEVVAVHASGEVHVFPADKNGALGAAKTIDQVDPANRVIAPGDLTSDGKDDLVYIDKDGKLWLRYGAGGHKLAGEAKQIGWGWTGWRAIPSGDLNGDGKVDLLGINNSNGKLFFYPGLGNGQFGSKVQVGWGWSDYQLFSGGDLNKDKKNDILGIDAGGKLFFYPGNGNGTFGSKSQVGWGWTEYTLASGADLNGDGIADIIGRKDQTGDLYYYRGVGKGEFASKVLVGKDW